MFQYIVRVGNNACPHYYSASPFEHKTSDIAKQAARKHLNSKGIKWSDSMIFVKQEGVKDVPIQKSKRERRAEKKKRKLFAKQSSSPRQRQKRSACRSKGSKYRAS